MAQNNSLGTQEQHDKMHDLLCSGYTWNRIRSLCAAGVILEKGSDFWFFGLDGEIMHNPEGYAVTV